MVYSTIHSFNRNCSKELTVFYFSILIFYEYWFCYDNKIYYLESWPILNYHYFKSYWNLAPWNQLYNYRPEHWDFNQPTNFWYQKMIFQINYQSHQQSQSFTMIIKHLTYIIWENYENNFFLNEWKNFLNLIPSFLKIYLINYLQIFFLVLSRR